MKIEHIVESTPEVLEKLSLKDEVLVVYNEQEYFIHNGEDTLVMLKGKSGDYHITPENIFSSLGKTGTHFVAITDSLDIALDSYSQWIKEIYHE